MSACPRPKVRRQKENKPEPVHPDKWCLNVAESLVLRHLHSIASEVMTGAVSDTLRSCSELFRRDIDKKRIGSDSIKERKLGVRINELRNCAKTLSSLITIREDEISVGEELQSIILQRMLSDPSILMDSTGAFSMPRDVLDDVARTVERTRLAVGRLAEELSNASGKSPEPSLMTDENLERAHIGRLMKIFALVRGQRVSDLSIGDVDARYNALLLYCEAANTPMIGPEKEFPIWIPGGTVKAHALEIRKKARATGR